MNTPCSQAASEAGEPLAGTAPHTPVWLVIEHPGPWGPKAIRDSDLPDDVVSTLMEMSASGVGVLLARRPQVGKDRPEAGHRVFIARTTTGGARMREGEMSDLRDLTRWNVAALAAGELPAFGSQSREPLLLVCVHGRRDVCCATEGRALLDALMSLGQSQDRIWECSHIGGHRFAPVALCLPAGSLHGRISSNEAPDLLSHVMTGRLLPQRLRGRTCLPAPLQAAEVAVRRSIGEDRDDVLDVLVLTHERAVPVTPGWAVPTVDARVQVRHEDGRAWVVSIAPEQTGSTRPESCGGESSSVRFWRADIVASEAWR